MRAQMRLKVSSAKAIFTDPTKILRNESMKQLHSIPLGIHSSPRNSLKVKSCPQPKVHLNTISFVHSQVTIWSSATDALINQLLDPLEFGWEFEEGNLVGKMTSRNIAPLEVVELVACKCSKGNLSYSERGVLSYGIQLYFEVLFI